MQLTSVDPILTDCHNYCALSLAMRSHPITTIKLSSSHYFLINDCCVYFSPLLWLLHTGFTIVWICMNVCKVYISLLLIHVNTISTTLVTPTHLFSSLKIYIFCSLISQHYSSPMLVLLSLCQFGHCLEKGHSS